MAPEGPVGGDQATIRLDAEGRYLDASPAALELFGVTRERLLSMTSAEFAVEPPDPEAGSAFRAAWEQSGRAPLYGLTTLHRPDGRDVRVRFVIEPQPDGGYLATVQAIGESVASTSRVFTLGEVLAEWRAAERRLATVPHDSEEWRAIVADVEALRVEYQTAFEAKRRDAAS